MNQMHFELNFFQSYSKDILMIKRNIVLNSFLQNTILFFQEML